VAERLLTPHGFRDRRTGRFTGRGSGIIITEDTLTTGMLKFPAQLEAGLFSTFEFYRPKVESAARDNAPWTDRTGNARQGLRAITEHNGLMHAIELFHQVAYGIWLEIRWSGRYAIIVPTIKEQGQLLMGTLRGLINRLDKVHA